MTKLTSEISSDFRRHPRVLVSCGPMRTWLDRVRYLQNRSSGVMGLCLSQALKAKGADVRVLLGPVEKSIREQFHSFEVFDYETAREYSALLPRLFADSDVFFSAAAVLDFEFSGQEEKLSREAIQMGAQLAIQPVRDFVAQLASAKQPHQRVVAFALEVGETEDILARAAQKLHAKNVDALIANRVGLRSGPDSDTNEAWLLRPSLPPIHYPSCLKKDLAQALVKDLSDIIERPHGA